MYFHNFLGLYKEKQLMYICFSEMKISNPVLIYNKK